MITSLLKKAQKYITSGNLHKAETVCSKILKKDPQQIDALHLLGIIALNKKHYQKAIDIFSKLVKINPNHAANCYNLASAYNRNNQLDLALKYLKQTINLQPNMAIAHRDLCAALKNTGDFEQAVEAGRTSVLLAPNDPGANYNLAAALHDWRDFEGSFSYYQRANELLPDNPAILFDLAQIHLGRGETDIAKDLFSRVIELYPREIEAHRQLMRLNKYDSPDHEDIKRVKAMQSEPWLTDDNRSALYFMLSKAYIDCGLHDEAFNYAMQGNSIQNQKHKFDIDEFSNFVSSLINYFTADRINQLNQYGNTSTRPIFIVGSPRSGTTLTEQILCSHPDVFGAGELNWVSLCLDALPHYLSSTKSYPACLENITEATQNELANKFLRYLVKLSDDESRTTDKLPANFLHLGFINILFPNAKIIHCQREPRDACISMFLEYFPGVISYSYDLYKLGAYYSEYLRLMEHWRSVLPKGTMMELQYETMIEKQEEETRRMLAFLNLEWNEACLSFHKKKRRIFTASHLQVTKPLYSSSVQRWKKYQKHLQPLEDGFNYQPPTMKSTE